jgi:broad specificity phosphatase PhoE
MKIFLIRHGQTTGDVEGRFGGDYDDCLTAEGEKQARELSLELKDEGIECIYYSPKIRTRESMEIMQSNMLCYSKKTTDLRERNNYGVITGLKKEEAKKLFPDEVAKLECDKINHGIKGSESYNDFKKRVIDAFMRIVKDDFKTIAIVTHAGPIRCIMREILGKELGKLGDCSFIEMEYDGRLNIERLERITL